MDNTHSNTIPLAIAPQTRAWRVFLVYDIVMMGLILINLLIIALDLLFFTQIGYSIANFVGQADWVAYYQTTLHPLVKHIDDWFTLYLVSELALRWLVAIIFKHHHRWFFFPFIHWYEVLACIPTFRALRLLRTFVIGYRLYQLGYKIMPDSWLKTGLFYYQVVMEEITDRVVLTVLDGVERELKTHSSSALVKQLIEQHRPLLNDAIAETLQHSLALALKEQQQGIMDGVGEIVSKAIADTPELHNILRLFPVVGNRLEQQIQSIGQRLGENITAGLIEPFIQSAQTELANPALQIAADYVGNIDINQPALNKLVDSILFESLNNVRAQVRIQHWKVNAAADDAAVDTERG